ncbi:interleukin-17 receptor B-like [Etheostoma cragini]|uniref:interleukin-17 receptor B-like n=1 Tax=Etheostoma cragini TaxID=417921 RepID=UPI00155F4FAB|nr:interleukin-17 receptor B-like [Etheostoma cragini]
MQWTHYCIARGSQWQPSISLAQITAANNRPELVVSFTPDPLCDQYMIIVRCANLDHHVARAHTANQTTLNVTFSLDKWPRSCCQFDAEIKPLFPECGQDCTRAYARILFVDFSSAFNTIIPDILSNKPSQLTVLASTCQWVTNFLTDRRQQVTLGNITSSTRTISTGTPQGAERQK